MKYAILFLAILASCSWLEEQQKVDKELEEVGVKAAQEQIELSEKLAEKELAK